MITARDTYPNLPEQYDIRWDQAKMLYTVWVRPRPGDEFVPTGRSFHTGLHAYRHILDTVGRAT